jgi:predicted ribosome quality control (RQC) complex YloA/Tae2 family protein
MPKKSVSSFELAAIVNELQFLAHSKISQLYHNDTELLLQLHVPNQGNYFLKILSGKWLCLAKAKNAYEKVTGFCQQLRKYLDGAIILSIQQKDSERIAIIELDTVSFENNVKKKVFLYLIIELFSKGNIILADKDFNIIAALESAQFRDRIIKPKEKYLFPARSLDYKTASVEEMYKIVSTSTKKNISSCLATEIGLGGTYAEELCLLTKIDKDTLPQDVSKKEVEQLHKALSKILKLLESPKGYIYDDDVTPIPLTNKTIVKETPTYNEALDALNPFIIKSPYAKKINSLQSIISNQEESIKNIDKSIELNKSKGDKIYEHYADIKKLLEAVHELRKTKDWKDVGEELKKVKKIVNVDLKNKKITLDL